ncbi:carboxylesterase/lipase family protein [Corynebacterium sp. sy017]|uniref:carboxylesterase/lipase family protein n=1 Tax=unclassified Corynebacterium TaxID=2624378 RepID=UPI0011868EBD|nr:MULTISPECIES: carboxylesterase/lipase family protein [unclassified Corynebacterium]MBP3088977.1 carboxylesterase/lipase family protein [Corynebacterium sp. sy017]QDZ42346.1 carboxylesterase/lipase family protein [Corynebacterium sp. sy039]TSD91300.1 carboxylesterase/lipase family protein [Corynebacterium sp. SY003]
MKIISRGPVAQLRQGKIEGVIIDRVRTWRGVAYGQTTAKKRRFLAPVPVQPWQGIKTAYDYGKVAPQPTYGLNDAVIGSQDCLNLDIVRPDTDDVLPVVVYFHGGSFIYGSSHQQLLRGHGFARDLNVVYVSINFRLGVLGYLDMRSLGDDCVANPAVLDQVLALQWIRENIAAFGGDPHNVTLMGESAGGAAVLTLMCVPATQGLFHRAIAQSPPISVVHSAAQSRFWTKQLVRRLAKNYGHHALRTANSESSLLAYLRKIPTKDLIRAGQSMLWRSRELFYLNSCYAPTVDKTTLPSHPLHVFSQGKQHKVPLLIGTNSDEVALAQGFYIRQKSRIKAATRMLEDFDPQGAPAVLATYGGAQLRRDFAFLLADALFWAPAMQAAHSHCTHADTWMYRFDFSPALLKKLGLGAMHAMELTPVFGDLTGSKVSALHKLAGKNNLLELKEQMQYHWAHFIHHGNPGHHWPRYVAPNDIFPGRATKIFDRHSHVIYDPQRNRRQAWQNYDMTEWGIGRPEV